ncbi:hypothetical protein ES703_94877 [subsurface metagenome]
MMHVVVDKHKLFRPLGQESMQFPDKLDILCIEPRAAPGLQEFLQPLLCRVRDLDLLSQAVQGVQLLLQGRDIKVLKRGKPRLLGEPGVGLFSQVQGRIPELSHLLPGLSLLPQAERFPSGC